MRIASSALRLESEHSQSRQHEISESMRIWTGDRPPDSGAEATNANPGRVNISDAGRAAQAAESAAASEDMDLGAQDYKLSLIRHLLARLTGRDVEVFDAGRMDRLRALASTASGAGYDIEYDRHESLTEAERTSFSASGAIRTADGKTIDFELSMTLERYYHTESDVSIRLGGRQTCDPLVINFSGDAAQLTDQRFRFDLNADGTASEEINFLGSGSGFLAFDRNADGAINDGSELFGARTGNGFAELAALDGDGNGWIDENDDAFAYLSVWIKDGAGVDILRPLKDMDIGAISLSSVSSPFSIKNGNNDLLGQVRASGIYLRENGGVGGIQQIDLTV
ncbi:MAG: VCBS repeat-containing protein [Candidatus Accumulibacter sp.]|jgi:hypothetical protein|nr:VCBS repeat-containing protein [Accumulibacter sp.]